MHVRDPLARRCGCSRGRASRRPHRRAARRCGTARASRARWRPGNSRPRGGRNCRSACSSRGGSRGAGPRARRARCRRSGARPCASVGKCAGTQSTMTPMPAWWQRSTKRAKVVGRAEAAGRREEADRLVAPGAGEGMLADRQALDMGEAHVLDVGDELVGKLVIGEEAVAVRAAPRAEMHLVDRHRRGERLAARGAPPSSRRRPSRGAGRPTAREPVAGGCSCSKPTGSALSGSSSPFGAEELVFVERAARRRRG